MANNTIYLLAAGVWTHDTGRALRMSAALKAKTVRVNTYRARSYIMRFEGVEYPGIVHESCLAAVEEYIEMRSARVSYPDAGPTNPLMSH